MTAEVLDRRRLNRALLARQLLLERSPMGPLAAIEHLVGMQAQLPMPPYFGLWTRLAGFDPGELSALFVDRQVVRIALMRSTVHLVSSRDALLLRAMLGPVVRRGMTPGSPYGKALLGVDLTELASLGRDLIERAPLAGSEIGAALQSRWPGVDRVALAFAVRALVPSVQVPPRGTWRGVGQSRTTSIEHWLGRPLGEPDLAALVRRYLAGYGPAGVRDAQAWSGLTGLRATFDALRDELVTFRDTSGVELFDLPEAPRPPGDTPAPVRLLPDFDAILLSHLDRSRIFAQHHKPLLFGVNGIIRSTVLIDGFVRALWSTRSDKGLATLLITPLPTDGQGRLGRRDRAAVLREARALLAFAEPGKQHEVLFAESAGG